MGILPENEEKELTGVCELFAETGSDRGDWFFHDNAGRGPNGIYWSYTGLRPLKNGDRLTIYHPKNKNKIIWSGVICLKQFPVLHKSAIGFWIHSEQAGVPPEKWARWFFREYPAKLIPAEK